MSFNEWAQPAPLPWVRWRLARILVAAMCAELAAVGVLLAVDAVEPADAEELLAVIAVPLYPLVGSVVTFYFATRRLGRGSEATYNPTPEPYWDEYEYEYGHDDTWPLDDGPQPSSVPGPGPGPGPTAPTLGPADVERICALAKWALGTATVALVAVTMWTLCGGGRVRPPQT